MFGSGTKTQETCLEKAARPQSYFLQEQSSSPSASIPLYVFLSPASFFFLLQKPWGSLQPVGLWLLIHYLCCCTGERGEGSFYLIDWKIYISFGKQEEWLCGGLLVNSDLTNWKEKDSLYFLKCMHRHSSTWATWYLLYVHNPTWIQKYFNTSVMSHLGDAGTNLLPLSRNLQLPGGSC